MEFNPIIRQQKQVGVPYRWLRGGFTDTFIYAGKNGTILRVSGSEGFTCVRKRKYAGDESIDKEAEILEYLRHDHIVSLLHVERREEKVYENGRYEQVESWAKRGIVALFIERCDASLRTYLDRTVRGVTPAQLAYHPSMDEARRMLKEMLYALEHLHRNRISHNDVAPQHVLVAYDGRLKLCDFSHATIFNIRHELGAHLLYQPPENRKKERLASWETDIYSVGVVFAEIALREWPRPNMPSLFEEESLRSLGPGMRTLYESMVGPWDARPTATQLLLAIQDTSHFASPSKVNFDNYQEQLRINNHFAAPREEIARLNEQLRQQQVDAAGREGRLQAEIDSLKTRMGCIQRYNEQQEVCSSDLIS